MNTIYGATAQKQIRDEYTADIGDTIEFEKLSWEKNLDDMTDDEVTKAQTKKNTFPFLWGLWTASLTPAPAVAAVKDCGLGQGHLLGY